MRPRDGFGLGCLKLLGMWTFLDRCLGVVLHLRFGVQICGDLMAGALPGFGSVCCPLVPLVLRASLSD